MQDISAYKTALPTLVGAVNVLLYCSQLRMLDAVMFAVKLKKLNATKRCLLDLVYILKKMRSVPVLSALNSICLVQLIAKF